jgi:polygalacturonase
MKWKNVKEYGAVGDGTTKDSSAIQQAIDKCTTEGGGNVYIPLGIIW